MWQMALIPGIIAGIGLALVIAELMPRQPKLADAIARLGTTTSAPVQAQIDLESRVGTWVHSRLPDLPGFTIPTKDLALVGQSVNSFLFLKTRNALLLLILPAVIGVLAQAVGFGAIAFPALLFGLPLAVVGWTGPDRDLKKKAGEAREEFARAVAVYLELVAAERKRGAPAAHALETAAAVGRSWVFVRIREELRRARFAGIPPWEALNNFSEEISVPELADVAKIIRLSGESGAAVYETLRQRGRSLRVQLLNAEQTHANEVSEKMTSLPLAALAIVFCGIILTPLLLTLVST